MAISPDYLQPIRTAIRNGNKELARELLRDILKNNPTAEVWYLAAMVASNKAQATNFLHRCLALDPFHDGADQALDKLKTKTEPTTAPSRPISNTSILKQVEGRSEKRMQLLSGKGDQRRSQPMHQVNYNILQDSTALFLNKDWELKMHIQNTVQLEKSHGVNGFLGFLAIFFFSLLGMAFVILCIAVAKKEKITLQLLDNGELRIITKKEIFIVRHPVEVIEIATSVKSGMTYAGAIGFGLLMTCASWFVIAQVGSW